MNESDLISKGYIRGCDGVWSKPLFPLVREAQSSELERTIRNAPMEPAQGEAGNTSRVLVSITSYRRRLIDPDNLCAKFFLDCCRYSGLIRDDRPEDIAYQISQVKVTTKEEEGTLIEITPL